MTIPVGDITSFERLYDKAVKPTLDFTYSLAIDKLGLTDAEQYTMETLLRQRVSFSLDRSGFATSSLVYDTYNNATLTIDQDNTLTVGTLKTNETVFLTVNKGVTDILTFNGLSFGIDSIQQGKTVNYYRIDSINGVEMLTQLNSQHSDSLVIGDLTSVDGSVTTFNYFKSTINNNLCQFEGSFTFTTAGLHNQLDIDITNWDVVKFNSGHTPMNVYCEVGGVAVKIRGAKIKEDLMIIVLDAAVTSGDVVILLNGSFKVK